MCRWPCRAHSALAPSLNPIRAERLWGKSLGVSFPHGLSCVVFMKDCLASLFSGRTVWSKAEQCEVRRGTHWWQKKVGGFPEGLRCSRGLAPQSLPCTHSLSVPQNRHCLLDIGPHAIERLHHMHIYPIVIFIHYKSAKHIK